MCERNKKESGCSERATAIVMSVVKIPCTLLLRMGDMIQECNATSKIFLSMCHKPLLYSSSPWLVQLAFVSNSLSSLNSATLFSMATIHLIAPHHCIAYAYTRIFFVEGEHNLIEKFPFYTNHNSHKQRGRGTEKLPSSFVSFSVSLHTPLFSSSEHTVM